MNVRTSRSIPAVVAVLATIGIAGSLAGQGRMDRDGCRAPLLLNGAALESVRVNARGRLCTGWPAASHETAEPAAAPADGAGRTFVASLIVPGSGQWLRGQSRSYAYLAVEAIGWGVFLHRRFEGDRLRERYRDLAWNAARSHRGGPRVDGDFDYYEVLGRFESSGVWDADPTRPGLQPETDPDTYNGSIWSLARDLYLAGAEDPDSAAWERAIEFYRERGFPPEMEWDWSRNPAAHRQYRGLIDRSDGAFRDATLVLGVIVANHLLSAVDGYLSARLSSSAAPAFVPGPEGPSASGDPLLRLQVSVRR